jgi:hypothetical protein
VVQRLHCFPATASLHSPSPPFNYYHPPISHLPPLLKREKTSLQVHLSRDPFDLQTFTNSSPFVLSFQSSDQIEASTYSTLRIASHLPVFSTIKHKHSIQQQQQKPPQSIPPKFVDLLLVRADYYPHLHRYPLDVKKKNITFTLPFHSPLPGDSCSASVTCYLPSVLTKDAAAMAHFSVSTWAPGN